MHDTLSLITLAALAFGGLMFRSKMAAERPCSLCAGVGSLPLRDGGADICRFCFGTGKRK